MLMPGYIAASLYHFQLRETILTWGRSETQLWFDRSDESDRDGLLWLVLGGHI